MSEQTFLSKVEEVNFSDVLGERYLSYALSTITSRSLPDVRDGLKPVHRRLLYAMMQLRLEPNAGFKKSARVVGDVIGKYHPHGDAAVYDALVRLAQDFSARYPLVFGQGNFGNIDGDNAAAMRYTEARMTDYAMAMLEGIAEDAVDFRENYDGSEREPVLLPAAVPNLLCNGATGIAVGMATSIPPHNLDEVCAALLHVLKYPNATISKLVEFIPGPDFPTGAILSEGRKEIEEAYATGRGSFRVRARWEVENLSHGQYQIVVTEIPFQVQKGRIIEKIADAINEKKLSFLADLRDESTDEIRLILEPKNRSVDPKILMEQVFRSTDLEVRISLNMNVLDAEKVPQIMNLREVLRSFLDHRDIVLIRRSKYRLSQIEQRLAVLEGYIIAYLNLDEVISIIRDEDNPKPIIKKKWKLSDIQAEAILNMRLRSLRRLQEVEIRGEHKNLTLEQKNLNLILKEKKKRQAIITEQIQKIRMQFGKKTDLGTRKTEIGNVPESIVISPDILIDPEPITIVCSRKGWVRTTKGHIERDTALKYKDGDGPRFIIHAQTTDKVLLFATNGRFYSLSVDRLPGGRGHGEPLRLMLDLPNETEIVSLFVYRTGGKVVVASTDGRGFVVSEEDLIAQTKSGKQVLNVAKGVKAKACTPAVGDSIAIIGENRKILIFSLKELPEMSRGRGVKLQSYRDGGLSDIVCFDLKKGLAWKTGAGIRFEPDVKGYIGKRAQAGRMAMRGFPRNNCFGLN